MQLKNRNNIFSMLKFVLIFIVSLFYHLFVFLSVFPPVSFIINYHLIFYFSIFNYFYFVFFKFFNACKNPKNTGDGLWGRDLNSGWNCTATKYGCTDSFNSIISILSFVSSFPLNNKPFSSNLFTIIGFTSYLCLCLSDTLDFSPYNFDAIVSIKRR